MPHKFYANCRDNLPKQKHRVKNGLSTKKAYGGAGDLTVWISRGILGLWSAPSTCRAFVPPQVLV